MNSFRRWSLVSGILLGTTAGCSSSDHVGPKPTVVAVFKGVIGSEDGSDSGTFDLTIKSDGSGSGTLKHGGVSSALSNIVATTNSFTATAAGGFVLTGTYTATDADGSFTHGGVAGLLTAVLSGNSLVEFCASHNGTATGGGAVSGALDFVWNTTTNALRGIWTGGVGSAFKGVITGSSGDNAAVMTGFTGTVTILPDLGPPPSVGGFYTLTSGNDGSMTGTTCP